MNDTVIEICDLGKRYRLGEQTRLDQTLPEMLQHKCRQVGGWLKGRRPQHERAKKDNEFWALRGISFEVQKGEVIGIIGPNGAGKSTLLKILSEITDPTEGKAILHGRVASLLEVGTGFHPELTGRENIYLNGSILGMGQREIETKFDQIVEFSGVEKFLDTPVKRYSSGMYVRLAFAIAAHLEPEILIVDEVLAVGDVQFQKRCLGKMQQVATGLGRTVLFVSHNMASVQQLCQQTILLERGRLVALGQTENVIQQYLRSSRRSSGDRTSFVKGPTELDQNKLIEFLELHLRPLPQGHRTSDIECTIKYVVRQQYVGCVLAVVLTNAQGVAVTQTIDTDINLDAFNKERGIFTTRCVLPASLLAPGEYFVTLSAADMKGRRFDYLEEKASFAVQLHASIANTFRRNGVMAMPIAWHTRHDKGLAAVA